MWIFSIFSGFFVVLISFYFLKPKLIKGIRNPPSIPIFGNVLEIAHNPLDSFQKYSSQFPEGIFQYLYFFQPVIVVTKPDYVKYVLNRSDIYQKEQEQIILDVIGKGLLLSNGELWRRQHSLMSPAFGKPFVKHMIPQFFLSSKLLLKKLENISNSSKSISIHLQFTKLTLDVIGLVGFGFEFKAQEDEKGEIPKAVSNILEITESRIFEFISFWNILPTFLLPKKKTISKFNENFDFKNSKNYF